MAQVFSNIGVVGAGQMGSGIAHVCALSGAEVKLLDVSEEALQTATTNIAAAMDKQIKREVISSADKAAACARIESSVDYAIFKNCDMVIEAATEDEPLKKQILQSLLPHIKDETLLATNTSSISITRLATSTDRPQKFCGVHFMNPVPWMQLVELIRGLATDEETFAQFEKFATQQLAKTISVSEDFPAFIVNRILLPMINEAVYTLYEGVGNVASIDTAMKVGTRHPMGPLRLADFIGLDTCLAIMNVLHRDLADTKYRPCPLLVKYVEAGWLGVKTKRGFYDYSSDTPTPTR